MKINNFRKTHFYLLILILFTILFSLTILGCNNNKKDTVCFEKKCFNVEKVKSAEELNKGLMYRKSLDEDKGMLFIFSKDDIYAFWMKNTLIPLDMIWINSTNDVVFIYKNATPCTNLECKTIIPDKNSIYVLEINSGLAEKYSIKIGDKVKIL